MSYSYKIATGVDKKKIYVAKYNIFKRILVIRQSWLDKLVEYKQTSLESISYKGLNGLSMSYYVSATIVIEW